MILKVLQNGKNSKIRLFECLTEISVRIGDPHTPKFFDQHLNFRMKVDLCFYHVCIKSYDPKQSGFQFSAKLVVHTLISTGGLPSLRFHWNFNEICVYFSRLKSIRYQEELNPLRKFARVPAWQAVVRCFSNVKVANV